MYKTLAICLQRFLISFITEEMDFSDNVSSYSSDSLDSTGMNWSDTSSSTDSIAAVNSEASSYNTETESDDDAAPIKPYQFEPSTELLSSSSEESDEDDKDLERDERLANTDW